MCECWYEGPRDRPTFHQLRLRLEQLLSVNCNYLDLENINVPTDDSEDSMVTPPIDVSSESLVTKHDSSPSGQCSTTCSVLEINSNSSPNSFKNMRSLEAQTVDCSDLTGFLPSIHGHVYVRAASADDSENRYNDSAKHSTYACVRPLYPKESDASHKCTLYTPHDLFVSSSLDNSDAHHPKCGSIDSSGLPLLRRDPDSSSLETDPQGSDIPLVCMSTIV